jgi:hypothetical protein
VQQDHPAAAIQSQNFLKHLFKRNKRWNQNFKQNKKSSRLDLITARMLKELPKEGLVNLMYIFNATLRFEYWPISLQIAQIIMIPKPWKNPIDVSSCRPISLLPTFQKY